MLKKCKIFIMILIILNISTFCYSVFLNTKINKYEYGFNEFGTYIAKNNNNEYEFNYLVLINDDRLITSNCSLYNQFEPGTSCSFEKIDSNLYRITVDNKGVLFAYVNENKLTLFSNRNKLEYEKISNTPTYFNVLN